MLFPTFIFAVFFTVVFFLHWRSDPFGWLRKVLLLSASLFFYGWWSWKFALMLLGSAVVNHQLAKVVSESEDPIRRKRLFQLAVVANLLLLVFFKYTRFLFIQVVLPLARPLFVQVGGLDLYADGIDAVIPLIDRIILPVGVSFFTFQALSYVVDVYKREIPPAASTLDFANYLAFFPQLVAGPIVRACDLLPQMEQMPGRTTVIDANRAILLILTGLFKKMVIANWLSGHLADGVFAFPTAYCGKDVLLGVYGYTLQIYCDFSAYSDIAIGTALLLGFHFPINFNAPYFAGTLQEFWHRWHISLSTWLRDYLYIPLGGGRCGLWRTRLNLMITFLLGGLWHGAGWTFIFWGAFHGFYLSLERIVRGWCGLPERPVQNPSLAWRILGRIWIFHLVAFSWILFRSIDLESAAQVLKQLFVPGSSTLFSVRAVLVLTVGYLLQYFDGDGCRVILNRLGRLHYLVTAVFAAVLLAVVLGLAPDGVMPFIYFQF